MGTRTRSCSSSHGRPPSSHLYLCRRRTASTYILEVEVLPHAITRPPPDATRSTQVKPCRPPDSHATRTGREKHRPTHGTFGARRNGGQGSISQNKRRPRLGNAPAKHWRCCRLVVPVSGDFLPFHHPYWHDSDESSIARHSRRLICPFGFHYLRREHLRRFARTT